MLDEFAADFSTEDVVEILQKFRRQLAGIDFPLPVPEAELGQDLLNDTKNQLDDYILPKFSTLDSPLLAVVGGSTGSGKSTLINSLIGAEVTRASAIRPTTRRPLLVCHPDDYEWFVNDRILPSLARVSDDTLSDQPEASGKPITELRLTTSTHIPRGLALLDSPDIDSVVTENRILANQLLAAADLWIFVTTAHRYADAIPWAMLDNAARRNVVVSVVLNRVPIGVGAEVRADLSRKLDAAGLGDAPLFVISERELAAGRIADEDVSSVKGWITNIATDATTRSIVAKQTLLGTVRELIADAETLVSLYQREVVVSDMLSAQVTQALTDSLKVIDEQIGKGNLLRGEVLNRWQDLVGTAQWTRKIETGISTLRDRVTSYFTSNKPSAEAVEAAIEQSTYELLVPQCELAIGQVVKAWENTEGAEFVLSAALAELRTAEQRAQDAAKLVREWQRNLIALIGAQGESKRFKARMLSLGVNTVGVALMIVVFASTGGLVGGEIAVAGGTAVVAQKLLEAVFGDEAVRKMAQRAHQDLLERSEKFIATDLNVFTKQIEQLNLEATQAEALAQSYTDIANTPFYKGGF